MGGGGVVAAAVAVSAIAVGAVADAAAATLLLVHATMLAHGRCSLYIDAVY
jgi:hypothetical protein